MNANLFDLIEKHLREKEAADPNPKPNTPYETKKDTNSGGWVPTDYREAVKTLYQQASPEQKKTIDAMGKSGKSPTEMFNELSGANKNSTRHYGMDGAAAAAENKALAGGATAEDAKKAGTEAAAKQGVGAWATGVGTMAAAAAAPGLVAKAAPLLLKYGINLADDALKGLLGELGKLFSGGDGDTKDIQMQLQQLQKGMDSNLQFDVKNLAQKAQQSKSDFAQKVLTATKTLSDDKV